MPRLGDVVGAMVTAGVLEEPEARERHLSPVPAEPAPAPAPARERRVRPWEPGEGPYLRTTPPPREVIHADRSETGREFSRQMSPRMEEDVRRRGKRYSVGGVIHDPLRAERAYVDSGALISYYCYDEETDIIEGAQVVSWDTEPVIWHDGVVRGCPAGTLPGGPHASGDSTVVRFPSAQEWRSMDPEARVFETKLARDAQTMLDALRDLEAWGDWYYADELGCVLEWPEYRARHALAALNALGFVGRLGHRWKLRRRRDALDERALAGWEAR